MGGGQDKPACTACPPGVKITRVGGKITRDSLPPGPGGQNKLLHRINSLLDFGDLDLIFKVTASWLKLPP